MKTGLGIHIFLFLATFLSLTYRESLFEVLLNDPGEKILWGLLKQEYPYSVSLLFILLCHEMGHYLPARFYHIRATLPYFIPMNLGPVGTMGAVIKIQEPIPDKTKLFDIGAGGPLMSLILSSIAWVIGLYWSKLIELSSINTEGILYFGDSLFTYWTGQWILGPYNTSTHDVMIHPLARAGWVGLLITAINLFPFGQLDGGHIIYALFGEKYRKWIYFLFLFFLILSLFNFSWLIWGFIIYFLIKVEHPFVPDSEEGLGNKRKFIGYFLLISLIFIFVPMPLAQSRDILEDSLWLDILRLLGK